MDEREWAACGDPDKMLELLQSTGKLSQRKARLFACAVVRRVWHLLTDERSRRAVDVAERFADGSVDRGTLDLIGTAAGEVCRYSLGQPAAAAQAAAEAIWPADEYEADYHPRLAAYNASFARGESEGIAQAALLRDLFGPLPPLEPSVWTWNDGIIRRLAEAAYENRLLPSGHLDPDRLAVLADALEEGGADAEMVGHLRGPGPHVRGCHIVDLLTGRE